jgi:hypothetical protein
VLLCAFSFPSAIQKKPLRPRLNTVLRSERAKCAEAISPYAPNGAQSILRSGEFYKHFTWRKKRAATNGSPESDPARIIPVNAS